jgi:hypothetical protein
MKVQMKRDSCVEIDHDWNRCLDAAHTELVERLMEGETVGRGKEQITLSELLLDALYGDFLHLWDAADILAQLISGSEVGIVEAQAKAKKLALPLVTAYVLRHGDLVKSKATEMLEAGSE